MRSLMRCSALAQQQVRSPQGESYFESGRRPGRSLGGAGSESCASSRRRSSSASTCSAAAPAPPFFPFARPERPQLALRSSPCFPADPEASRAPKAHERNACDRKGACHGGTEPSSPKHKVLRAPATFGRERDRVVLIAAVFSATPKRPALARVWSYARQAFPSTMGVHERQFSPIWAQAGATPGGAYSAAEAP